MLAAALAARLTQPPFDASAMDGYALRAADAAEIGSVLTVIGESAAGHGFSGGVGVGQAVRIFTGAPVPSGADSILLQEDAEKLDGGRIRTTFAVTSGRHIRPRGQDFVEGDLTLKAGVTLDFSHLTLAAAMNHQTLPVYRRPRIAILATGDELVTPGTVPARTRSSARTRSALPRWRATVAPRSSISASYRMMPPCSARLSSGHVPAVLMFW